MALLIKMQILFILVRSITVWNFKKNFVTPECFFSSFQDDTIPVPTIEGALPKPGAYVLVAHYYQPERPRNAFMTFTKTN